MADLTDFTVTPMICIGMGISIAAVKLTTGLSMPLAVIIGIFPGYIVGVCAGLLLAAVVGTLLDFDFKIRDARKGSILVGLVFLAAYALLRLLLAVP
jgi:hypothetical protein